MLQYAFVSRFFVNIVIYFTKIQNTLNFNSVHFSPVIHSSPVWLFVTPWTAACQASLSITNIKRWRCHQTISSCCPLLLLPSIFPNIRVFSSESFLHIRWPNNSKLSFIYFLMQQISTQRLNKSWKLEQPFSQAH